MNYTIKLFLVGLIFHSTATIGLKAQACQCDKVLARVKQNVENNYAGWFDKVNFDNVKKYHSYTEPFFTATKDISNDSICAAKINEWLSYFYDKNLKVFYNPSHQKSAFRGPAMVKNKTEAEIKTYLQSAKSLDPLEGIYSNEQFTVGITRHEDQSFAGIVISSALPQWKTGDLIWMVIKKKDGYEAQVSDDKKSATVVRKLLLQKNILDIEGTIFVKTHPEGKKDDKEWMAYELKHSTHAPKLEFKDKLAIVTLPAMGAKTADMLGMLMDKEKGSLEDASYWIIDLRNTRGSNDQVLSMLLPYLYTGPMVRYHSEIRMTQQNFDMWYDAYAKSAYTALQPGEKKQKDIELDSMKACFGRGYKTMGKVADTLVFNKVAANPKKVAVLINAGTEQGAELFTYLAKQSDKVTIMGENSGGNVDYDLMVYPPTYCSQLSFQMPIQRRLWLEAGYSMDKVGIKPDVVLKGRNWVEDAYKILEQGK